MGCWNETCMITQLPIGFNQKVVLFILKKMRNRYVVSSFAIKGIYDDYGKLKEDSIELHDEHLKILKYQDDFSEFNSVYEIIKKIEREELKGYALGFVNLSVFNNMLQHINNTSSYSTNIINSQISDLLGKSINTLHHEMGVVYFDEYAPKNNVFLEEVRSVESVLYELRNGIFIELFNHNNDKIIPFISELIVFNAAMFRGRKIYTSFSDYSGSQSEYYGIHSILSDTVHKEIELRLSEINKIIETDEYEENEFDYMFKK